MARDPDAMYEALQKTLTANIRALRLSRGVSQKKLAEMLCCSQPYIANIEGGNTRISLETLCWLAWALGTEPDLLMRKGAFK